MINFFKYVLFRSRIFSSLSSIDIFVSLKSFVRLSLADNCIHLSGGFKLDLQV